MCRARSRCDAAAPAPRTAILAPADRSSGGPRRTRGGRRSRSGARRWRVRARSSARTRRRHGSRSRYAVACVACQNRFRCGMCESALTDGRGAVAAAAAVAIHTHSYQYQTAARCRTTHRRLLCQFCGTDASCDKHGGSATRTACACVLPCVLHKTCTFEYANAHTQVPLHSPRNHARRVIAPKWHAVPLTVRLSCIAGGAPWWLAVEPRRRARWPLWRVQGRRRRGGAHFCL